MLNDTSNSIQSESLSHTFIVFIQTKERMIYESKDKKG